MALVPALLAAGGSGGSGHESPAFTPTSGALLEVSIAVRASATPGEPTISDKIVSSGLPLGLTWNLARSQIRAGTPVMRLAVYTATAPASPVSMTVSGHSTSAGKLALHVREVPGGKITANAGDGVNGSGDPAVTMGSTPGTGSVILTSFAGAGSVAITPPAGFTELGDAIYNTDLILETAYSATPPPSSFAYSSTATASIAIGIEVEPVTVSAVGGFTETLTPTDAVGMTVAATAGLTEALTALDGVGSLQTPGSTSPENPTGVYSGAAAVWKWPTGGDVLGINALAPSGITATTVQGPAGQFAASSVASRVGPIFASMSSFTLEAWVQATTFGALWRIGPTGLASAAKAEVRLNSDGSLTLTRSVGAATQISSTAVLVLAAGVAAHIVAVFPSNSAHLLYVNGAAVTLTHVGAAINGPLNILGTDEVAVGAPSSAPSAGLVGKVGRVTLWPFTMTAQRATISYRHQSDAPRWIGVSGENLSGDTNRAPVAVPFRFTATAGQATTPINVRARAFDPDGDATAVITGSLISSVGTASIMGGDIVYTPPASTPAGTGVTVQFDLGATATAVVKLSRAKLYGTVSAPVVVPVGTPKDPPALPAIAKRHYVGGTTVSGASNYAGTNAGLALAFAAVNPGDHIIIADGTYDGTFKLTRSGATSADFSGHIVVRPLNFGATTLTGFIEASGNYYWWYGFVLARPGSTPGSGNNGIYEYPDRYYSIALVGNNQLVTRCHVRSPNGIWIHDTANSGSTVTSAVTTHHITVAYNTFTGDASPIWNACVNIYMGRIPGNKSGPYNVEIAYNNFNQLTAPTDDAGGADRWSCVYTGNSKPDNTQTGNTDTNFFHHNIVDTIYNTGIYAKRGMNIEYNSFNMRNTSGDQAVNMRHGGRSPADGSAIYTGVPVVYTQGNLFRKGNIQVSDTDYILRSNSFQLAASKIMLFCGSSRDQTQTTADPGYTQAAHRTVLVDNRGVGKYVLGMFGEAPVFILDLTQGGLLHGVRIFQGGGTVTPWPPVIEAQHVAATDPYTTATGDGGHGTVIPVVHADLVAVCGHLA